MLLASPFATQKGYPTRLTALPRPRIIDLRRVRRKLLSTPGPSQAAFAFQLLGGVAQMVRATDS